MKTSGKFSESTLSNESRIIKKPLNFNQSRGFKVYFSTIIRTVTAIILLLMPGQTVY